MPYSLCKKLLYVCALGFCNQVFLDLHIDEVKNFAANNIFFKLLGLVMYWDLCKGVSHVLGFVQRS